MEWAGKVIDMVTRASNNNMVINTFLVGAFAALSLRSVHQQRLVEALEAEKNNLLDTNKSLKKSMWHWKQQLLAQASDDGSSPLSLSKLKAIYGEAPIPQQGVAAVAANNEGSKASSSKFVV